MPTGTIKWFNNVKGYGFVLGEGSDGDLFVHYSSITMEGYKTLKAGQMVTYDIIQGPKGLHAVNVVLPSPQDDNFSSNTDQQVSRKVPATES
ncbi:MAG: cold shock domain-containing protein [Endozoicomonadaceae bacterium]|nr:cold shock domain-containing protein [Endozoicomonadaceae bacterium]